MSTLDWATKEVELACKHENPNWDGKSFDYGCACYQSALKAFKSLCEDGHSGFSWSMTTHILERLMKNLPLKPITLEDFGYIKGVTPEMKDEKTGVTLALGRIETDPTFTRNGVRHYQCPRKSDLWLEVNPDNTYKISDNGRVIGVDVEHTNLTFFNGSLVDIVDEMFPVQFPYYPQPGQYHVYTRTFLTNKNCGDFDTRAILYLETPDGKRIDINRFWHETPTEEWHEISAEEYKEVEKMRIDKLEQNITGDIVRDLCDDLFDKGEYEWSAMFGEKWEDEYTYKEIWWALGRLVRRNKECDGLLDGIEYALHNCISLFDNMELCNSSTFRKIAHCDTELVKKYPVLSNVYIKIQAFKGWLDLEYTRIWERANEHFKYLNTFNEKEDRKRISEEIVEKINNE